MVDHHFPHEHCHLDHLGYCIQNLRQAQMHHSRADAEFMIPAVEPAPKWDEHPTW